MMEKVTAGRDELGEFAPKFAQLNDDVLFGEVWSRQADRPRNGGNSHPRRLLCRLAQGLGRPADGERSL